MPPPPPTHEEIVKESFLYYNVKGKDFVIEKMVEDGIPRNMVHAEFERYKREHYDLREEERSSPFSIAWGIIGIVVGLVALRILLRTMR